MGNERGDGASRSGRKAGVPARSSPFKLPKCCLLDVKYGCCGLERGFILPSSGKRLKRASKGRRQLERRLCCLLHIRAQKSGSFKVSQHKYEGLTGSPLGPVEPSLPGSPRGPGSPWRGKKHTHIRWWKSLYGSVTIDSEAERANT